jgi:hypothetical protein
MFCISTPDEFFAALSGENVSGGLINRFLVIESNDGIEQHQWKELNVPRELVEKLKLLRNGGYQLGAVGNECGCLWDSEKKAYSPQGPMPPLVKLLWADEDAVMNWAIFKENMKARRAGRPNVRYLSQTNCGMRGTLGHYQGGGAGRELGHQRRYVRFGFWDSMGVPSRRAIGTVGAGTDESRRS